MIHNCMKMADIFVYKNVADKEKKRIYVWDRTFDFKSQVVLYWFWD